MLYELMIVYRGSNWIYFETNERDLWEAYAEYKHLMTRCKVNIDNMYLKRIEIRTNNEDYETLDWNEIDEHGKWAKAIQ